MDKPMHGIINASKNKSRYRMDRQPRSYGWNTKSCFTCGRPAKYAMGSMMWLTCGKHK